MKIEDTPFAFYGQSAVEKLKRQSATYSMHGNSAEGLLDDLDLSFLDLLTTVAETQNAAVEEVKASLVPKKEAPKAAEKTTDVEKPKLTLVESTHKADSTSDDPKTHVDKEMSLLQDDLTSVDLQYLKQAVIPGLPILMGSVPFESIFPVSEGGEISYKGFEVSSKLAELIEKGYKTGQPIRVELDANSSIVLKIRNGQVSAEFVSADKGAILAMQQELDQLRNKMLQKNLPVGSLEYKYRDPSQSKQQNQPSEESDDE